MTAFSAQKISEHVYWVGAIDWAISDFHGYSTARGTTYNAYLILGKEPILIDTVKEPFFDEMMSRIRSVIDPSTIKTIISNHAELDHSGSLPKTIQAIRPEKIFASKMGAQTLKEILHLDAEIAALENHSKLTIGDSTFTFVETRMLHWPDSMFTYFENDKVLFSQDGFGMHLASDQLFADQHDPSVLRYEAAKYYANILLPYSAIVSRLIKTLPSFNLDIQMIAPDHGPVWRTKENIQWIIQLWKTWSELKSFQKVVIVYDTMWQSTAKMADAIADGAMSENSEAKVMPLSHSHRSDIATELLEAGALIVGSPTLNQTLFPTVADCLCYLKGLNRTHLIGQTFGSYGWADKSTIEITGWMNKMNIQLIGEPVSSKHVPTEDVLNQCRMLGQKIAVALKEKSHD